MDSLQVVGWVGTQVGNTLPGLDPTVHSLLVGVIASLVLSLMRFLILRINQGEHAIASVWEKYREVLNPIIAGILGFLATGNPVGFLLGAAGRGVLKAGASVVKGTASAAGVSKAKAVALALVLGLSLMASQAPAQSLRQGGLAGIVDETKPAAKSSAIPWWQSPVFALGFGARQDWVPNAQLTGFGGVQVGFVYNDHISPRARLTRDLKQEARWGMEAGIWFVL